MKRRRRGDLLRGRRSRRPPQQVAGAEPEPAAVHQQIANRQLARDERIPHLEPRQVAHDRRVPLDLALLDQQAERRRGEDLRVGRDAEQRAGVHRRRARPASGRRSPSPPPPASSLTMASRQPGNLERLHDRRDEGVEIGRQSRLQLRSRRDCPQQDKCGNGDWVFRSRRHRTPTSPHAPASVSRSPRIWPR